VSPQAWLAKRQAVRSRVTLERRLPQSGAEAHVGERRLRVRPVLDVDDLAVLQPQGLGQGLASPFPVGPGERNYDPVAARLDGIEAVVASAEQLLLGDPFVENLTGLVGATSRRRPEQPPRSALSAPLRLGVDQRDKRLNVACTERLIRGTNNVQGHPAMLRRSLQTVS